MGIIVFSMLDDILISITTHGLLIIEILYCVKYGVIMGNNIDSNCIISCTLRRKFIASMLSKHDRYLAFIVTTRKIFQTKISITTPIS